ncbi:MAG: sigma-54-dependent Fis family transcriptional regulator [Planctomycetes bacterium]|nr:sigma-54-dependent Fis family transcriptional regulator [Planctomycetota bacterium]
MHTWPTRVGAVLQMLDPATGPRLIFDRLWQECLTWKTIGGIWLQVRPGHLTPSGTFQVGEPIPEVEEIAELATAATAPIHTDALPVIARQLRDGNVPIATLLVSHHDAEDAAAFVVDVLSRWCMDRLRLQLEVSELSEENHVLRGSLTPTVRSHEILTVSGMMHSLIASAVRAAASSATVLIQGETGTGKELLARLIQTHSHRAHKPMVSVNAGALSPTLLESELFGHVRGAFTGADHDRKGVFEVANGGTLFLDEVAEIGPEAQVRLLRVLQERCINRVGDHASIPVDVRIIAATHRDLVKEVQAGRFREDLFYRLNVVNLVLPPLRERPEDIPLLVNHFLQQYNRQNYKEVDEIPRQVLEMLCAYPWPGNVRELENCVQKAVVLAPGRVFIEELVPPTIRSYADSVLRDQRGAMPMVVQARKDPQVELQVALERYAEAVAPDIGRFLEQAERILIAWALNRERGIKLRAAKALGINRVTLDRKLVEYDIHVKRGHGIIDLAKGA